MIEIAKLNFTSHQERLFKRLKKGEKELFIKIMDESLEYDKYSAHDFINMYFMNNGVRPKNWAIIDELCHSITRLRD